MVFPTSWSHNHDADDADDADDEDAEDADGSDDSDEEDEEDEEDGEEEEEEEDEDGDDDENREPTEAPTDALIDLNHCAVPLDLEGGSGHASASCSRAARAISYSHAIRVEGWVRMAQGAAHRATATNSFFRECGGLTVY